MPAPAPIDLSINQLTDKIVDGNGIFDCLMTAMNKHIESQYTQGRIRDTDYAELYTEAIQSTLAQSIGFMIQTKQAAADIDLTRQKLETEKEQTKLATENARIATKEYDLKCAQISKLAKDEELVDQEILLKEQQVVKLTKDSELIDQEILVKQQQVLESVQKVITAQKQNAILDKQALKIMEEIELLNAKRETEVAQIRDTVNGTAVTGIIGKQVALYDAQKEGFKRDAEQKLAKLMADLWAVDKSTDNSVARPFTGTVANPVDTAFSDPDIVSVFKKAIAGIDA